MFNVVYIIMIVSSPNILQGYYEAFHEGRRLGVPVPHGQSLRRAIEMHAQRPEV